MQLARYGNAWIGRFSFLMQKQNAITIQNSIKTSRQKVPRTGANTHYEYSYDYFNSDKIANVYFTSDINARNRVRDLNEYNKINLNTITLRLYKRAKLSISIVFIKY